VFAYAPYVREMNLWLKYVDEVEIVAPKTKNNSSIFKAYKHDDIKLTEVDSFSLLGIMAYLKTLFISPKVLYKIYKAMKHADHIHLRCPGNMGLLGSLVQILFPHKPKTVKYAGNWDPKAKQPWSYKLQKRILSNTALTKNCSVLVYGEWPNQPKTIIPFFTATYSEDDKTPINNRNYSGVLKFLFVGTLSKGKQPLKAIQLVETFIKSGREATLDIYGEGEQQTVLEDYIKKNKLSEVIRLKGNQSSELIKSQYQNSHFLILPSKSEGWPKVVAEAMFWGCIPITTPMSCVPWMLDYGKRGFLIDSNFKIETIVINTNSLKMMSQLSSKWSREFTLDKFEKEIKKLLL
jgi:glycosyltransferase involved in cell wall biosynthesis